MTNPDYDHFVTYNRQDGSQKRYPTFDFFLSHLIEIGEIKNESELVEDRDDLLSDILIEWERRGQIACSFGVKVALKPIEHGFFSAVFDLNDEALGEKIDHLLINLVENQKIEVAQIIFKKTISPEDVVRLINRLCTEGSWYWKKIEIENKSRFPHLLVGLRWMLPSRKRPMWTLGFSPFEPMPVTRKFVRAPFSAIAFRPSDPEDFKDDSKNKGMHIADMPIDMDEEEFKKNWTKTEQLKKNLMGDQIYDIPWVQVTFALPSQLENDLVPPKQDKW